MAPARVSHLVLGVCCISSALVMSVGLYAYAHRSPAFAAVASSPAALWPPTCSSDLTHASDFAPPGEPHATLLAAQRQARHDAPRCSATALTWLLAIIAPASVPGAFLSAPRTVIAAGVTTLVALLASAALLAHPLAPGERAAFAAAGALLAAAAATQASAVARLLQRAARRATHARLLGGAAAVACAAAVVAGGLVAVITALASNGDVAPAAGVVTHVDYCTGADGAVAPCCSWNVRRWVLPAQALAVALLLMLPPLAAVFAAFITARPRPAAALAAAKHAPPPPPPRAGLFDAVPTLFGVAAASAGLLAARAFAVYAVISRGAPLWTLAAALVAAAGADTLLALLVAARAHSPASLTAAAAAVHAALRAAPLAAAAQLLLLDAVLLAASTAAATAPLLLPQTAALAAHFVHVARQPTFTLAALTSGPRLPAAPAPAMLATLAAAGLAIAVAALLRAAAHAAFLRSAAAANTAGSDAGGQPTGGDASHHDEALVTAPLLGRVSCSGRMISPRPRCSVEASDVSKARTHEVQRFCVVDEAALRQLKDDERT